MSKEKITRIPVNDMDAIYITSDEGNISFLLIPHGDNDLCFEKAKVDPLIQISVTGDASSIGFAAGETRHDSALSMSMKFVFQEVIESGDEKKIITGLRSPEGIEANHTVISRINSRGVRVYTEITNKTGNPVTIEALSSINLSGITPYCEDEGRDRLVIHRFRSRWSEEARLETRTVEDLLLEPSWADFGVRCEKFGTLGSMPVRGYFPFIAVEDTQEGTVWALSLACSSSWQIEAVRIDKCLCITGGLVDYEFGHWRKVLDNGQSFATPEAYVTAGKCDLPTACDRLLDVQKSKLLPNQCVSKLPAVFNEYCTTWGEPSEKSIEKLLSVINGDDFEYFVIDAGWYADSVKGWQDNMGDWNVASDLFPNGIKKSVDSINAAGMKAGIWFELEVVGKDSDALSDTAHLLTRDGKVIISGTRRFWDMRSEYVNRYLTEKVITFLNESGFKYIKIDYNDTIGIGCDGADSPGEGLRACIEATKDFFRKIRESAPDIAIEICSSGGHRLEPGFMELADYLSFSDAHEEKEIPVIAADLHNLVLPQKSQIWAVLRKNDDLKRIVYSICAGMYGVLCISGDVTDLSEEQRNKAREGIDFYKKVSPIIISGTTKRFGPFQNSNRELKGYQVSVRYGENGGILVIAHSFKTEQPVNILIDIPDGYKVIDKYETADHSIMTGGCKLEFTFRDSFDAFALLLEI